MSITKLEKNKVYADGFELGYVGSANPRKARVRFFPESITTTNHQTNVTQKHKLAAPILIAQVLDGTGGPYTDRSIWAPHPKQWWATEQLVGGVVYSIAHTADEVAYFADNAKFQEIGFKSADGSANQDPRHFGNATTKKEGEEAVAGLFFMINDSGIVIRVDKDGKPLNPDGTYVNELDDPAKKTAAAATTAAADAETASAETLTQKAMRYGKYALYAVGGGLVIGAVVWVVKKVGKTGKKRK